MAIYTKTGDKGQTSLASGQRVEKTVDELNSWVEMLRASMTNSQEPIANSQLEWVQNKLFNLGAALSEAPGEWIVEEDVTQLEQWIDAIQAVVPPQRAFLLPSGSETVCRCHVCRTVCRRAERRMLDAQADEKALRFINRLSDYLFVLSRHIAYSNNEIENMWKK